MNTQLARFVLVFALTFVTGCVINGRQQAQYVPPSPEEQAANMPEEAVAQQASPQQPQGSVMRPPPVAARPQPPTVQKKMVGPQYSMYAAQIQAPTNMSVHLFNESPFFGCVRSPLVNGAPVFRLRYGNYEQDFLPTHPGWSQVGCAAVLMPNMSGRPETAPEAWLAARYPGTFKLWVDFFTYDGVSPQPLPGSVFATSLSFPNTFRMNGSCLPTSYAGCLYNVFLQAEAEVYRGTALAFNAVKTVSFEELLLNQVDQQLAMR